MPPTIAAFAGTLGERPGRLLDFLKQQDEVSVRVERLMTYASCKGDQDIANGFYQDLRSKAVACVVGLSGAAAFARPRSSPSRTRRSTAFLPSARRWRPTAAA